MTDITLSPFGTEITPEEVLDTLSFFDDWEERYKYIIDLGKQLPAIDESKKTEAVVLSSYNNKTPSDILNFDIDDFFAQVDLVKHLSPTRGNGLTAMVKKIQQKAELLSAN